MLLYKGFLGQIDYDHATDSLVGEVVNSIDVLEFSGNTAEQIRVNFQACIDDYLVCQMEQVGVSPTPFVGNFTLSLSTDKQKQVIRAALKDGQSVAHWLNQHIDAYLQDYFKKTR